MIHLNVVSGLSIFPLNFLIISAKNGVLIIRFYVSEDQKLK